MPVHSSDHARISLLFLSFVVILGLPGSGGGPRCAIKGREQTEPGRPDPCCVSGVKVPRQIPATWGYRCSGNVSCSTVTDIPLATLDSGAKVRLEASWAEVSLRILLDRTVLELFDGVHAAATGIMPGTLSTPMAVSVAGPSGTEIQSEAWRMREAVYY